MSRFVSSYLSGDREQARTLDDELQPIHEILFCEPSPTPTKWALHAMARIDSGIRLPLLPLTDARQAEVRERLQAIGALT